MTRASEKYGEMFSRMPKVSIVTPLYNKADYIAQTMASVLRQSFANWEMIVIDNGSTDGGFETARRIDDGRMRFAESARRGPGAARNVGVAQARGEWVLFLDADDLLEPEHLARLVAASEAFPTASIVAGGWQEFLDGNESERVIQSPFAAGDPPEKLRAGAIAAPPWAIHAAMVRRRALTAAFLWPEELDGVSGEDIIFWFRLTETCETAYAEGHGALYRMNTPNCRGQSFSPANQLREFDLAADYNVRFLTSLGRPVTSGHCETFVRVYSQVATNARRAELDQAARTALARADEWLRRYFEACGAPSRAMRLRRALGLRNFQRLTTARNGVGRLLRPLFRGES